MLPNSQSKKPIGTISLSSILNKKTSTNASDSPSAAQDVQTNQPITHPEASTPKESHSNQNNQGTTQPTAVQQSIDFSKVGLTSDQSAPDPVSYLQASTDGPFSMPPKVNETNPTPFQNLVPSFSVPPLKVPPQPSQIPQPQFNQTQIPPPQFHQPPAQSQSQPFQPQPIPFQPIQVQQAQFQPPQLPAQTQIPPMQVQTPPQPQFQSPPSTGFIATDFGTVVTRFPIERDKFVMGINYRRGIVSRRVFIVKYHFEEGIGTYFCFGGACCDRVGIPQLRYVIPDVCYDSDPATGQIISRNFELSYLQFSERQYKAQIALDASSPFDSMDYIISCTDEKWQNISITSIGPSFWRQDTEMYNAIVSRYREVEKLIPTSIASTITPEDYARRISQISQFYTNPQGIINNARSSQDLSQFMRR